MRTLVLFAIVSLALGACCSCPPPQPTVVVPPGSTVVCPNGSPAVVSGGAYHC